ncbi:MAG: hypothetical protein ACI9BK_002663, partial [Acidimicrobiales bacterium]
HGVDTIMAVEFGPTEDDYARTRACLSQLV